MYKLYDSLLTRNLLTILGAVIACCLGISSATVAAAAEIAVGDAVIQISENGDITNLRLPDGSNAPLPATQNPFCVLEAGKKRIFPEAVQVTKNGMEITFSDESQVALQLQQAKGFTIFRIVDLDLRTSVTGMKLPIIPMSTDVQFNPTLNSAFADKWTLGVLSASPEVLTLNGSSQSRTADLPGCTHSFIQVTNAKEGSFAAEFVSTCSLSSSGWSMQGNSYSSQISRDSVTGLKAWVHGDGNGQQFKFQLVDAGGGITDYYVPIDFTGWREITMTDPALHIVKDPSLTELNLYYNGIPGDTTVRCLVDDIRVLVSSGDTTNTVTLETFEEQDSSWWNDGARRLALHWDFNYAGVGDDFGIIASANEDFFDVMPRFEAAAGILTPYPDGVWNKKAPSVKESYLFLTSFSEAQFNEALSLAKEGGFKHVLLEQHSWCESTGHYGINKRNFPDGLQGLVRTVNQFRDNGIKVGLHLLGASIDNNDPYLTPVPDNRLFKDARTSLVSALDSATTTIVVTGMPEGFPAVDGGYNGDGTILQIGSELIRYGSRTTTAPFTFYDCVRGYHGTVPSEHQARSDVHHLARSYGYHMMDMDTSLLDEVTSNFAEVANACDIDMVYFDGSERLQGEHQRYNARLVNAYLSKLNRKDIVVQASNFSHHSWHQLARTASADGHGDLKGYLEQRSPSFKNFAAAGLPLDVGWYYGYDILATPDMYEYILGATIGYDSSFSFQISVPAAQKHPFTREILNLISRYEKLRLSGRVDDHVKALLRVHEKLQGKAPEDASRDISVRRDYRLVNANNNDVLQRIIYGEWQNSDNTTSVTRLQIDVTTGPALVGVQLQVLPSAEKAIVNPRVEINGNEFRWQGSVQPGEYVVFWPGEPARLYSSGDNQKEGAIAPSVELEQGTYKCSARCDAASSGTYRVRVNLQCPERHVIP